MLSNASLHFDKIAFPQLITGMHDFVRKIAIIRNKDQALRIISQPSETNVASFWKKIFNDLASLWDRPGDNGTGLYRA